jgi:hypothetical protein
MNKVCIEGVGRKKGILVCSYPSLLVDMKYVVVKILYNFGA